MGMRKDILATIKSALEGLAVTVNGEDRVLTTVDTLFDPTAQAVFPIFSITPGAESFDIGIMGLTADRTMTVNLFGYVDGGSMVHLQPENKSTLAEAAEDCIQAIITKLTSSDFLTNVACAFSIINVGPISVEHAELENPLAYISLPVTVQWIE